MLDYTYQLNSVIQWNVLELTTFLNYHEVTETELHPVIMHNRLQQGLTGVTSVIVASFNNDTI